MSREAPIYAGFEALAGRGGPLAVVGDTQRTSRLELWWRAHDAEQEALFEALTEARPAAILHLGDLVTWGPSRWHWRRFDRLHAGLRAAGVPVFPVLGNHDYMPLRRPGPRHVDARFPHLAGQRWFVLRHGALAIIALDSNFGALGRGRVAAQDAWLAGTLGELEDDTSVAAVVAAWHHPPWTNSLVVSPSAEAARRFVAPLARARKVIAIFNGHCHAYEHFVEEGLHAFVSGGRGRATAAPAARQTPALHRPLHLAGP